MNVTSNFKDRIQIYLNDKAQKDPLFAEELKKPNKNIDGCLAYICDTARKMAEDEHMTCNMADELSKKWRPTTKKEHSK